MQYLLDVLVLAVILGCAVAAWKKGFIRAAFGFLPMLAALVGMHFVSPYVGKFLRGTFLFDSLSGSIRESMGLEAVIEEGAMQTQTEIIEAMPLPGFLKEALLENNNPVIYQLLDVDSLKEYIAGFLANVCLNILSVVLAFLLIYIAVTIVLNALHLFSKLPVLSFFNHFMGFLIGGVKGTFFVWLGMTVLTFFQCRSVFEGLFHAMEMTYIANILYENNILQQLILTIFT
ncbi:CvpA family protein [Anaerotignum sp.]